VKRLDEKYDWRRWPSASAWAPLKTQWQGLGIDPEEVVKILHLASENRIYYEDLLVVRSEMPSNRRYFRAAMRDFNFVVRTLRPALKRMKRRFDLFGALPRLIEQRLADASDVLGEGNPEGVRLPRRRPGEPWLRTPVPQLAALFRAHGVKLRPTIRLIQEAFAHAGHQDYVTFDKIRHILRQSKKQPI